MARLLDLKSRQVSLRLMALIAIASIVETRPTAGFLASHNLPHRAIDSLLHLSTALLPCLKDQERGKRPLSAKQKVDLRCLSAALPIVEALATASLHDELLEKTTAAPDLVTMVKLSHLIACTEPSLTQMGVSAPPFHFRI